MRTGTEPPEKGPTPPLVDSICIISSSPPVRIFGKDLWTSVQPATSISRRRFCIFSASIHPTSSMEESCPKQWPAVALISPRRTRKRWRRSAHFRQGNGANTCVSLKWATPFTSTKAMPTKRCAGLGADFLAAIFFAESRHARLDRVADLADLIELFFMGALCLRRIRKGPVQTLGWPGKNRTSGRLGFRTHGYDVGEKQSCLEDIKHGLCFLFRDIDADLAHHFYRERIQRAGLKACALRCKKITAACIEKSFRHLAPRA